MHTICPVCGRQSPDGNLYCEKPECPAESAPLLLDEGDLVGDMDIVKLISLLPTATIYTALRQDEKIFVKIAHQGDEHKERLKREAAILRKTAANNQAMPYLPTLLPPYSYASVDRDDAGYGKIGFSGLLLYYYVFDYAPSESLTTLLAKQPQLWINHVGWLMVSVATAMAYLQRMGIFHYALSPAAILVRFDAEPPHTPRAMLADLGVAAGEADWVRSWYPDVVAPAYAAPELISEKSALLKLDPPAVRIDPRTDVYGLGAVLYELLVGEAPVPAKLRTADAILSDARGGHLLEMSRHEDVRRVAEIAVQSTAPKPAQRADTPAAVGRQLLEIFGDVPAEKKRRTPSRKTVYAIIGTLLLIALLLALALAIT